VFSDGHAAAQKEHVTLEDFANDEWILLPRNVNATIHDTILETAAKTGIPFRQAHGVINAEQAFYLVSERAGVAILPRPSTLGATPGAVVVRPLSDPALSFATCLVMRRDDDSKLVNQYARAFLKKYVRKVVPGRQMELPLSADPPAALCHSVWASECFTNCPRSIGLQATSCGETATAFAIGNIALIVVPPCSESICNVPPS
jgi:LysR substrate binding domain